MIHGLVTWIKCKNAETRFRVERLWKWIFRVPNGSPTGIWKVMGSTPVGDSENSFFEYFDLRALLRYFNLYSSHQTNHTLFQTNMDLTLPFTGQKTAFIVHIRENIPSPPREERNLSAWNGAMVLFCNLAIFVNFWHVNVTTYLLQISIAQLVV